MCVECVEGGPLYSALRSVPAKTIHGNTENRLQEDQHRLPTKVRLDGNKGRFGWPHLGAPGHRLSSCVCLVGTDVGMSVPGSSWSVWSVRWVSLHVLRRMLSSVTLSVYSLCFLLIPDLCS